MSERTSVRSCPQQARTKRFWITLSFVVSTAILIWSFTLPFRHSGQTDHSSAAASSSGNEPLDRLELVKQRRSSAEAFLETAVIRDEEFMWQLARRHDSNTEQPGIEEAKLAWDRHVASVRNQLNLVRGARKGTLEWQRRQELIESLEDAPR